jgi:hypothetical protein
MERNWARFTKIVETAVRRAGLREYVAAHFNFFGLGDSFRHLLAAGSVGDHSFSDRLVTLYSIQDCWTGGAFHSRIVAGHFAFASAGGERSVQSHTEVKSVERNLKQKA